VKCNQSILLTVLSTGLKYYPLTKNQFHFKGILVIARVHPWEPLFPNFYNLLISSTFFKFFRQICCPFACFAKTFSILLLYNLKGHILGQYLQKSFDCWLNQKENHNKNKKFSIIEIEVNPQWFWIGSCYVTQDLIDFSPKNAL